MADDTHKFTAGPPLRVAAPARGTEPGENASMNRKGWISKWAFGSIRGNSDRPARSSILGSRTGHAMSGFR